MYIKTIKIEISPNDKVKKLAKELKMKIKNTSQLNALKNAIKKDTNMLDKAYTALGRQYYKKMTPKEKANYEYLVEIIEHSQSRLERAYKRYAEISGLSLNQDEENEEVLYQKDSFENNSTSTNTEKTTPEQKSNISEFAQEDSF
jgi:delta 1-pyrroline-5-carboxylate dehydrogenase